MYLTIARIESFNPVASLAGVWNLGCGFHCFQRVLVTSSAHTQTHRTRMPFRFCALFSFNHGSTDEWLSVGVGYRSPRPLILMNLQRRDHLLLLRTAGPAAPPANVGSSGATRISNTMFIVARVRGSLVGGCSRPRNGVCGLRSRPCGSSSHLQSTGGASQRVN